MKKPPPRKYSFLEALFTREERLALIFLVSVGFLGLGIMAVGRSAPQAQAQAPQWEPLRINEAGLGELMALPGVGPKTAERILDHRKRHGRFLTLSDLKKVKGMGGRSVEKLKKLVRFN